MKGAGGETRLLKRSHAGKGVDGETLELFKAGAVESNLNFRY